jgi:transposase
LRDLVRAREDAKLGPDASATSAEQVLVEAWEAPAGNDQTGNAHLRRVLVESARAYGHRPAVGGLLKKRQQGPDPGVRELAWKAQRRLHSRYRHLTELGKNRQQTSTSIGQELLGFIWAIAVKIETKQQAGAA